MELQDIVEVAEARRIKANLYLEHGYRLLAIMGTSEEDKGRLTGQPFIRRGIKYVLGRSPDVAHYEAPDWRPPVADEPPEGSGASVL
jgi:hypothetical protein